jgi:hypothetical protein
MKTTINKREKLDLRIALGIAAAHRTALDQLEEEVRAILEDDDENSDTIQAVWHGEPPDVDEFLSSMGVAVE